MQLACVLAELCCSCNLRLLLRFAGRMNADLESKVKHGFRAFGRDGYREDHQYVQQVAGSKWGSLGNERELREAARVFQHGL